MATKIVTKNSSTASAVPTASDLVQGELAVNVADKRLFTEDNAGAIVELGTNPSALTVTGEITANGGIALGDGDAATFGDSDDLSISHAGGTTYLTNTTGSLVLRTDSFRVLNTANSEQILHGDANGAVTAYYDNAAKLATTSTGIDVTGNLTMASGGSIVAGGANDLILNAGESGTPDIYLQSGSSTKVKIEGSDGSVGIGTSSPSASLDVRRGDADGKIAEFHQSEGYGLALSSSQSVATITAGYNQAFTFETGTTATERMRIDSSGNLLVGTTDITPGIGDTNAGISMSAANGIIISRANDAPINISRNSSDGDLTYFRKDGAIVGSIKADAGSVGIGSGDCGLLFYDAGNRIIPRNGTSTSDNSLDLGATTDRFKDLYLSGTATMDSLNLGGGSGEKLHVYDGGSVKAGFGVDLSGSSRELSMFHSTSGTNGNISFGKRLESNGAYTEAVRIDGSGNVGIGESNPKAPGGSAARSLTLKGTSYPQIITVATAATANSTTWRSISRSTHVYQIQTVNDAVTDEQTAYEISRGAGLLSISYQRWYAGTAEAMRIDSSGNLMVGKTSSDDGVVGLRVSSLGVITSTIASPSTNTYLMYSGGYKFYVNTNGGISNFSANNVNLSDEREKKNIELLESQWDSLKQWSLKKFHYNADDDSDNKKLGVIAQEVATHNPEVIDEFNVDDDTTRMAVKEQQMMWMAIKALQEAQTRIETLEARVTELENN